MSKVLLLVVNHAGFFLSHRLPLAEAAREAGYEVHIATPRSRHTPAILGKGLHWHPIRLSRSRRNAIGEVRTMLDLFRLYRAVKPDLIHHVTLKPALYGTLAARVAGLPRIINALAGLGHLFERRGLRRRLAHDAVLLAFRLVASGRSIRFIFQNPHDRDLFVRHHVVDAARAVLIRGSGVDIEQFRPQPRDPKAVPLIILPSRMLVSKGVPDFCAAAAILSSKGVAARFALVGEPDPDNPASIPEGTLRSWAAGGVVEFWGRHEDMPAVYAQADIVCLPTYYPEGVPKVLIEAASCGLPIVATDVPGCREIVRHGENGLLVPPHDPEGLAAALQTLIADASLRAQMGRSGREIAAGEFSLAHVVDATLSLYEELIYSPL